MIETRQNAKALSASLTFLNGGGEMGALIRAHHWGSSLLGYPENWPQPLRTAIRLLLNTGHPMYVWWGPDLLCFYNDAYRRSIGPERHPGSLGRPAREVWAEIWDIIGPQIDHVMMGRGATWQENDLVPITRRNRRTSTVGSWIRRSIRRARIRLLSTLSSMKRRRSRSKTRSPALAFRPQWLSF
jgi:hypothetical protein